MKHIMLFFDRMPIDDGATGKEHIGKTSLKAHKEIAETISVFPITKGGLSDIPNGELQKAYAHKEEVVIVNRGEGKVSHLIHYFLLLTVVKTPMSFRDFLVFLNNYHCYARSLADIGAHFHLIGKPSCLTVSVWGNNITAKLVRYASEFYEIPFVIWEHRTNYQRLLLSEKKSPEWASLLLKAQAILAVSPQLIENIKRSFPSSSTKQFHVLPNPVDESFCGTTKSRNVKVTEFAGTRYVFAGVENWQRKIKRLDILLLAVQELLEQNKPVCLVLVGNIPHWLPHYIRKNRLEKHILPLGRLPHAEMAALYASIDCCVISSDDETFGNPAVESLATGKPVVATRSGGPESIIDDIALGRIVEPSDSSLLAQAMTEVLDSPGSFDSQLIREICLTRFGLFAHAEYWKKAYHGLGIAAS